MVTHMSEDTMKGSSRCVLVNGRSTPFTTGETVADLMSRLGLGAKGTAVAQNAEVLPRSMWHSSMLRGDDVFEVLAPQAGG